MRIEVSIAKTTALPNGALEALNNELSRRIAEQFPAIDSRVSVRYATGNQLSVWRPERRQRPDKRILQETWEARTTGLSTISPEAWRDPVTLVCSLIVLFAGSPGFLSLFCSE